MTPAHDDYDDVDDDDYDYDNDNDEFDDDDDDDDDNDNDNNDVDDALWPAAVEVGRKKRSPLWENPRVIFLL